MWTHANRYQWSVARRAHAFTVAAQHDAVRLPLPKLTAFPLRLGNWRTLESKDNRYVDACQPLPVVGIEASPCIYCCRPARCRPLALTHANSLSSAPRQLENAGKQGE